MTKSLDKEILASTLNLDSQLARRKNSNQSTNSRSQQLQERMNAISQKLKLTVAQDKLPQRESEQTSDMLAMARADKSSLDGSEEVQSRVSASLRRPAAAAAIVSNIGDSIQVRNRNAAVGSVETPSQNLEIRDELDRENQFDDLCRRTEDKIRNLRKQ